MSTEIFTNRLVKEKSPYLLQHAHNPVNWYAWGEAAFEKARKEDKPIFLSVGYSTCHWCHVMEEESFENVEIAKVLNESFVAIKVDREERPDIDHIYMTFVQAMTGSGGWPMSVFLTPDLKPFYGGTYFPAENRWGRPGFKSILLAMAEKWKSDRPALLKSSEDLTQAIHEGMRRKETSQAKSFTEDTLKEAYLEFRSHFDSQYGGFGDAPKFPRSHTLSFILRFWKRTGESQALEMVKKTLSEMAKGGVYDQLGGGFHRYSVDGEWRVPHFEKMLYDQAILSKSYLEAYQATGNDEYAKIAKEILEYVLRDLRDPQGAFYSAEDADSAQDPAKPREKSEGAFYIWAHDEILEALGSDKGAIFNDHYNVEVHGNALQDPQGEFREKNILYVARSVAETAKKFGKTKNEIEEILKESRGVLFKIRALRPRPHLDDKVLADWNGLMISSLAFASRVLHEPRYLEAATQAADFILNRMKTSDGRLMHRYRDGDVAFSGLLEDYAFFTLGLFDLYESSFDPRYLEEAKRLSHEMARLFWDEAQGGFFLTANDAERLILKTKEFYDGAIPSGNSVAALGLLRIGRLTVDTELEKRGRLTLDSLSAQLSQVPSAYPQMLIALDFALGPTQEIVIAGNDQSDETQAMVSEVFKPFSPNQVVAFRPLDKPLLEKLTELAPFAKDQPPINGKTTVYICKNYVCQVPVTNLEDLREQLSR